MSEELFGQLLQEAAPAGVRFGHRQHVHLTWLAVRRYGMPAAIRLVSDGIRRTARYAGAPQKYHETISRAWVELVAHHAIGHPAGTAGHPAGQGDAGHPAGQGDAGHPAGQESDFATFAAANPLLLDKRL